MIKLNQLKLVIITVCLSLSVNAQKITNLYDQNYLFIKFLNCNFNTTNCTFIKNYNTIVTFNIDNNGKGTIVINGPEKIITEITRNEILYGDIGRKITFYTTRGNRVIWYIDNNDKSQTISLVTPDNRAFTYSNQ